MRIGLDFDGTLVSCRERHSAVLRYASGCLSMTLDAAAIWKAKRRGHSTVSALRAAGMDWDVASRIERIWLDQIEALQWLGFDVPLACPGDMAPVRAAGHTLHVISARSLEAHLQQQMRALGLERCFESVDVVSPAQAVEQKALALAKRGVDVYIGDSESDLQAAQRVGVPFRAVASGMREASELFARGAREVCDRLTTYLEIYAKRDGTP